MTKLNDIVNDLNLFFSSDAVFLAELKKTHLYRDAHDLIKKYTTGILPKGLYYTIWELKDAVTNTRVAEYQFDFKKYKNVIHVKGNFLAVTFQAAEEYGEMALPDITRKIKKQLLENGIKRMKESIAKQEKELTESITYLEELGNEYRNLYGGHHDI